MMSCAFRSAPRGASSAAISSPLLLARARAGFQTRLTRKTHTSTPAQDPPHGLFDLVRYPSPLGDFAAYLTAPPASPGKLPAVVWLTGEFRSGIDCLAWTPGGARDDRSGSVFREAGLAMLYPSLRGGNDNPGCFEGFFGEVDDVIAAANYLRTVEHVDPARIYLGGHSTGGTLALLVAESTDAFRAVFSFGPVEDVLRYGKRRLPFDDTDPRERELRAPGRWLHGIRTPTFIFEGSQRSNIRNFRVLENIPHPPCVQFHEIPGANHFSGLRPIGRLIADKIRTDTGALCGMRFTEAEIVETLHREPGWTRRRSGAAAGGSDAIRRTAVRQKVSGERTGPQSRRARTDIPRESSPPCDAV